MKRYKVGDQVKVVETQLYKGQEQTHLKVGDVGEVIAMGWQDEWARSFTDGQRDFHVLVKVDGKNESWTQINCLEPLDDISDEEMKAVLASIGMRGDLPLTFDEIVFRDQRGERFIIRPNGSSVYLTDEKGTFELTIDYPTWHNITGLVDLALKAAA